MVSEAEGEHFVHHKRKSGSPRSRTCRYKCWHRHYPAQEAILRVIESNYFRALVIFLVVADTALVIMELMLDTLKIHHECDNHTDHSSKHHAEVTKHRIELAMEVAHYLSIAILSFFFVELLVRIVASGREFWNYRRKKMEYFDAFIVITSLAIDLSFLRGEKKIVGEQLLLILSFRLWRFVRIISSVGEGIRHGQRKHKEHLNEQYMLATRRLIDLIKYKTNYAETNRDKFDGLLEHFRLIDRQCDSSYDELDRNHILTSSEVVEQFLEELNGIENKSDGTAIACMLIKPTHV